MQSSDGLKRFACPLDVTPLNLIADHSRGQILEKQDARKGLRFRKADQQQHDQAQQPDGQALHSPNPLQLPRRIRIDFNVPVIQSRRRNVDLGEDLLIDP